MTPRATTLLLAMMAIALLAAPLLAAPTPQAVGVEDSSFEWTGKQGRTANFNWSATVVNPTKRPDLELAVTLTLVDGAGNILSSDSTTVSVAKEGQASVTHAGSLPYDDAAKVTQYRVSVERANR